MAQVHGDGILILLWLLLVVFLDGVAHCEPLARFVRLLWGVFIGGLLLVGWWLFVAGVFLDGVAHCEPLAQFVRLLWGMFIGGLLVVVCCGGCIFCCWCVS